jgi:hypothetical protein
MLPVLFYPHGHFAELSQLGFAEPVPALLFNDNEATVRQNFYVQGDSLAGDVKLLGDGIYIMWLRGDHVDDCPPGGVSDGLVYVTSGFHNMQVYACKYKSKHLLAQIFL